MMVNCPHCSSDSVSGRYCGRCGQPVDLPVKAEALSTQKDAGKIDLEKLEAELKKNPDKPQAYIDLARGQLEVGKQEQAYSTFRAGRTIAPDHLPLLKIGGEILEALNRREEAIEILERVVKKDSDDVDSALSLTSLLYDTGQRQNALRHLKNLDQKAKDRPEILIKIAQIHLSLGNAAEAQKSLSQYRDIAGNTREMFILMGQTMLSRKFYDGAIKNFREAIKFFPDDAQMRLGLGKAYLGMGEKGQALLEFEQGLNKSPGYIEILVELGKLQNAMGMEDQADITFEKIEKSKSTNGESFLELARHFIERNSLNRALKYLKTAHELSPYHVSILQELGQTYERMKDFSQATRVYEET
ncbi:MAG: tetratricopeptide repeat protein, partial [Candidatus Riflebacteria bacterium]